MARGDPVDFVLHGTGIGIDIDSHQLDRSAASRFALHYHVQGDRESSLPCLVSGHFNDAGMERLRNTPALIHLTVK
jgi:hypothetical protein